MKNKSMEKVLANRAKLLEKKQLEAKALQDKIFSIPEISNAQADFINASFSKLDPKNKITQKDIDSKHNIYVNALKKHGYTEDAFKIQYNCHNCNDTGTKNGKICSCVWNEYIKQLETDCNILNTAPFTFEDCDLKNVKDEAQKKLLTQLYKAMKDYVNKFPKVNTHIITLSGQTGTGKSALAQATARAMVKKGYSALFMSAYEFNDLMLRVHTSPIEMRNSMLENILTCDMLVIDDLGTEPPIKKVTVEYLLLVLEQRANRKLSTIITTNLSLDKIMSRYYERIYSRLCDKAHSKVFVLNGKDLRL